MLTVRSACNSRSGNNMELKHQDNNIWSSNSFVAAVFPKCFCTATSYTSSPYNILGEVYPVGPLVGNQCERRLVLEFQKASPTFTKIVTIRENGGSQSWRRADVVAWQSDCRTTRKELWAWRKVEEKKRERKEEGIIALERKGNGREWICRGATRVLTCTMQHLRTRDSSEER